MSSTVEGAHQLDDLDKSWFITTCLLHEADPEYNERHALSQALERWEFYKVSKAKATLLYGINSHSCRFPYSAKTSTEECSLFKVSVRR